MFKIQGMPGLLFQLSLLIEGDSKSQDFVYSALHVKKNTTIAYVVRYKISETDVSLGENDIVRIASDFKHFYLIQNTGITYHLIDDKKSPWTYDLGFVFYHNRTTGARIGRHFETGKNAQNVLVKAKVRIKSMTRAQEEPSALLLQDDPGYRFNDIVLMFSCSSMDQSFTHDRIVRIRGCICVIFNTYTYLVR